MAKTVAEAASAAAAFTAINAARRAEEAAQGMYSPRPFAAGTLRSPTSAPLTTAPLTSTAASLSTQQSIAAAPLQTGAYYPPFNEPQSPAAPVEKPSTGVSSSSIAPQTGAFSRFLVAPSTGAPVLFTTPSAGAFSSLTAPPTGALSCSPDAPHPGAPALTTAPLTGALSHSLNAPQAGASTCSSTAPPSIAALSETPQTGAPIRSAIAPPSAAAFTETPQTRAHSHSRTALPSGASYSRAETSRAAPAKLDSSAEPKRHAHKRRPTSPLQPPIAKRAAETGSSAENPWVVDFFDKSAAEARNRFSGFAFEKTRAEASRDAERPPPALVIAKSQPNAEVPASNAAESASHCPTPHLLPFKERDLYSPRSPSPPRYTASSSTRDLGSAFSPRFASPSSRTPTQ